MTGEEFTRKNFAQQQIMRTSQKKIYLESKRRKNFSRATV